jgi:NADH:ubiquinone oxidoreductase subunit 3 (subunit A)
LGALGAALTVLVVGLSTALVLRWTGDLLSFVDPTAPEKVPYSGGLPPTVHAWHRFHARYYPMALLFLAFDMEMVFMYPWAVVFRREGQIALVEMLMFIVVLLLGVLYAWRERALKWA